MDVPRKRWNSTFAQKPFVNAKRLKGRKRLDVPGPRLRAGRRMNEWSKVWRFLKPRLEAAGRTVCEFDFVAHDCWGAIFPCHSKKRRNMEGNDIYLIALGCQQIARYLDEDLDHATMQKTVLKAIQRKGGAILPQY